MRVSSSFSLFLCFLLKNSNVEFVQAVDNATNATDDGTTVMDLSTDAPTQNPTQFPTISPGQMVFRVGPHDMSRFCWEMVPPPAVETRVTCEALYQPDACCRGNTNWIYRPNFQNICRNLFFEPTEACPVALQCTAWQYETVTIMFPTGEIIEDTSDENFISRVTACLEDDAAPAPEPAADGSTPASSPSDTGGAGGETGPGGEPQNDVTPGDEQDGASPSIYTASPGSAPGESPSDGSGSAAGLLINRKSLLVIMSFATIFFGF